MTRRVLILGSVWPEPTSSAAGLHHWSLIHSFKKAAWEVTYLSPSVENRFTEDLRKSGIKTISLPPNDSRFDAWIAELQPDYAVFDRFILEEQFGWRVREHSPQTVRILDTEDLHCLRRSRERALKASTPLEKIFRGELDLINDDSLREIASIYRSDRTLLLSTFELDLLRGSFGIPEALLGYFPFCYQPAYPSPAFAERSHFVMIGNFRHAPNADATFWLKREIWPRIRKNFEKLGNVEPPQVHIYGAYPSREIMALHDPASGFYVKGPAEDQYEVLARYRVNLAPLRFGAGIKGKIADGWWRGIPAVTTPIGMEGMTLSDNPLDWGAAVAETTEQFADSAVELYRDPAQWEIYRQNGLRTIAEIFDFEKNSNSLIAILEDTRASVEERRKNNFIGAMLWHHSHKSTTYFSRWIELKESLQTAAQKN